MKISVALVLLTTVLAGCATSSAGRYQDYKGTDVSCVESNSQPNVIKLYTEGEAHVWIKEVDGVATASDDQVCLSPGRHELGIRAFNRYDQSTVKVDVEIKPGRKYYLLANKLGITFHYKLFDKTTEPAVLAMAFSTGIMSSSKPASSPIFIPVRK